ncbi:hypothetical protein INR49_011659 [Caranx melampygus]|nr:hypothetical protein INR49_011659 [Caranx melampygus]
MSGPEQQQQQQQRALLELNLRRETWCQVEGNPRCCWDRAERRHYRRHLRTSPALLTALTAGGPPQPRAAGTERPPPPCARRDGTSRRAMNPTWCRQTTPAHLNLQPLNILYTHVVG